jgi:hypothetical protein
MYGAGDDYDCDWCAGTHTVRRGKRLDAASGSSLEGALYARCERVGVVDLSGGEATRVSGGDRDGGGDDASEGWP